MPYNTRNRDPDLTTSWDYFDSGNSTGASNYTSEDSDEPTPLARPAARANSNRMRASTRLSPSETSDAARRRITRSSVEPELVMPSMSGSAQARAARPAPRRARPSMERSSVKSEKIVPRKERKGASGKAQDTASGWEQLADWLSPVLYVLNLALSPIIWVFRLWLSPLVSYAGALAVLILFTVGAASLFYYVASSALSTGSLALTSTICNFPIVGLLPFCPSIGLGGSSPDFGSLVRVQNSFGSVLQAASDEAQLPANLKESEMSVRDLKLIVKFSDIPSRSELVFEIDGFIEGAQQLGMQLTSFNARVGSTMDRIASITRATERVLEGEMDRAAGKGSISRFLSDSVPAALGFPTQSIDAVIERQYFEHIEYTDQQLTTLIAQAQALLASLTNLDERIDVIGSIAERDKLKVIREREVLLSSIWTFLGAHGTSIKRKNDQTRSLENIMAYRQQAFTYISNAVLQMQRMQHEIQELRTRVVEPEVIGGLRVPLWQHLEYVRMGLQRMDDARRNGRQNTEARLKARISPDEARLIG